jgi:hypothetical protein
MAIMRTNRLTSKTTTPPSKPRRVVPASELEAQDLSYKKYQEDVKSYGSKLDKYNKDEDFYKKSPRSYANWGGIQGTRELNKAELAEFNKAQNGTEYDWVRTSKDFKGPASNISGFHGGMKKPTAPQKVEPADWSTVELNKMPTKKASVTTPKGKLKEMKVQEFSQFEAPSAVTTKTKTRAAMTGGGEKLIRAKNPSGSLGAARVTTEKKKAAPGYNRERKQFEAFAKPLPSGGSLNVMEDTSPVIKRAQAEASQLKSAYRKEGNREGVRMMGAEAKQLGRAAKFADKMYEKGGGDYFTRDMVKGFRGSDANPANQNTIKRQEQLLNKRK